MSLDVSGTEWEIIAPLTVDSVGGTGANTKSWLDLVLSGMIRAGLGIQAICLYLTVSAPELDAWVRRLHLPPPQGVPLRRPEPRRGWTAAEVRQLIDWWGKGIRVGRIAEALGRSKSGIYYKKRRLGLPARDRKSLVDRDLLGATDVCIGAGVEVARTEEIVPTKRRNARRSEASKTDRECRARHERSAIAPPSLECIDSDRDLAAVAVERRGDSVAAVNPGVVGQGSGEGPGSVRLGTASPELLAAIDALKKVCRPRFGCVGPPDWSRSEMPETEVYELALRAFGGQSRFGIAHDMGITAKAVSDRLSRLGFGDVRRGWRQVEVFDVAIALDRLGTSGAVARVDKDYRCLFFVSKRDRKEVHRCPEYHRKRRAEEKRARDGVQKSAAVEDGLDGVTKILPRPAHDDEDDEPREGQDVLELGQWKQRQHARHLCLLEQTIAEAVAYLGSVGGS